MARKPKVQPVEPSPAGFISRFAAWFVDQLIIIVAFAVMGMALQIILAFSGGDLPAISASSAARMLGTASFSTVVSALYMGIFWYLFDGSTLGQLLFGLRVVKADGSHNLSFWQVVVRVIGFYISMAVFFLGFLWILIDRDRRGWHDRLARTKVIYTFDVSSVKPMPDLLRVASSMRRNEPAGKG
jgi:uncharacterized RDD family membrane protein YckC